MSTILDRNTGKRGVVKATLKNGFSVKFPGEPLRFIPKLAVEIAREAVANIKVQGIKEDRNGAITYDTESESLVGNLLFALDPNYDPIPELDFADGTLNKTSIYYGPIVVAALKFLNQNKKDFSDPRGIDLSQVNWVAEDIQTVRPNAAGALTGEIDLHKQNAAINVLPENMEISGKRKASFNINATKDDVAQAFSNHETFFPSAGSMTLVGGVVYSYSTPIAYWANDGVAYVNNEKFSKTTSGQVSAIVRALTEDGETFHLLTSPDFASAATSKTPLQTAHEMEEDIEEEIVSTPTVVPEKAQPVAPRVPIPTRGSVRKPQQRRFSRMIPQ